MASERCAMVSSFEDSRIGPYVVAHLPCGVNQFSSINFQFSFVEGRISFHPALQQTAKLKRSLEDPRDQLFEPIRLRYQTADFLL
jgi:hypothetical protein